MLDDLDLTVLSDEEQYETILDTMYNFVEMLMDKQVDPHVLGMVMMEVLSYCMFVSGDREMFEELLEFGKTFEWPEDRPTLH